MRASFTSYTIFSSTNILLLNQCVILVLLSLLHELACDINKDSTMLAWRSLHDTQRLGGVRCRMLAKNYYNYTNRNLLMSHASSCSSERSTAWLSGNGFIDSSPRRSTSLGTTSTQYKFDGFEIRKYRKSKPNFTCEPF